jgi:signal transduction histidine kinase
VAVRLGLPESGAQAPLARRLVWTTAARLGVLTLALGAIAGLNFARGFDVGSATVQWAVATLGAAFALAAASAVILRRGRHLTALAVFQLLTDQIIVTALAYVTGGAASGATSFYGITILEGAFLLGLQGASVAALAGAIAYGTLVASFHRGWIAPPSDQAAELYRFSTEEGVFYLVVNLLVLIVVTLLASYLAERLRHAGGRIVAAEARADQAERMAELGRLAAGLAHEIRNPLGSIAGSVELLEASPKLDDEDRQLCAIIHREASRLNDLVSDMMNVAKPRKPDLTDVDVARVAREVVELATGVGRGASDVEVHFDGPASAVVRADAAQMRQVIWNLVRNAVQASSAGDSVRVGIECDEQERMSLFVADDGPGLTAEARERLFDAFFTTRAQGTGIGLAVVKRIVDEHGFAIEVDSAESGGACFWVRLGRGRAVAGAGPGLTAALTEPDSGA